MYDMNMHILWWFFNFNSIYNQCTSTEGSTWGYKDKLATLSKSSTHIPLFWWAVILSLDLDLQNSLASFSGLSIFSRHCSSPIIDHLFPSYASYMTSTIICLIIFLIIFSLPILHVLTGASKTSIIFTSIWEVNYKSSCISDANSIYMEK